MSDDQRAPQWGDDAAGITKQDLLSTAVGVFVIGCVVGWALFGGPNQIVEACKSASLPNWLAAAGTWVIGAGAFWYARESHVQRVHDSYFELLSRATERLTRLTYAKSLAGEARAYKQLLESWTSDNPEPETLKARLNVLAKNVEKFEIATADLYFASSKSASLYRDLKLTCNCIVACARVASDAVGSDREAAEVKDTMDACVNAAADAEALVASLDRDMSQIYSPVKPKTLR